MPWDSTLLHEASVEDLLAQPADAGAHVVAGGPGISAVQPTYAPDGRLWFLSDESNWWNPWTLEDGATRQALDVAADLATPQWVLGMRDLAFLADGRLVLRNPDPSTGALALLDPADRTLTPVPIEASHTELISTDGDEIALKRGLGDSLPEILRVRTDGSTTILATSSPEPLDPDYVSRAEEVSWTNGAGLTAYGNFYAPTNAEVTGPEGELPPLLVFVHGGPTAQALPSYQSTVQFWTTRGFAVLDVNHGGSTGYGRDYRERLRGQWGVVDLDDCVTGAAAMAAAGRVDGARLAIRGGSAGGYTTLRALTASDVFAAGTSLYGISDLRALLVDDHKFESRYTIGLVGPWPEAEDVYLDRSPISHIGRLHGELLLLQGEDDKVVPLQQAQLMADGMAAAGKDVELVVYPGEGHGFRQASTIEDALTRELAFYQRVLGLG
jgi:dipeptidyl aminopeptidase/acylaminoacyl peptidase